MSQNQCFTGIFMYFLQTQVIYKMFWVKLNTLQETWIKLIVIPLDGKTKDHLGILDQAYIYIIGW